MCQPTHSFSHAIRLTFARNAEPGTPLPLNKESTRKLAEIPRLLRALAKCYGSKLGAPTLWGGHIHLAIGRDAELFDLNDAMVSDLATTAHELHENSQRQPPLPVTQAVTNPHCLELLRALAQTYYKSELTASMHVAGQTVELPHIALSDFTEPDTGYDSTRYLRAKVIGVCVPAQDANAVLLDDLSILELPTADYPHDVDEIYQRVVKCTAVFFGPTELIRKNVYRAMPGGTLQAQLTL